MTLTLYLAVVAAGALGALARWGVSVAVAARWRRPGLGTLMVNLLGAFALGAWLGAAAELDAGWLVVVGMGFLGAFTTFSTWMAELAARWRAGAMLGAILEGVATLGAGTALAVLGALLTSP